MEDRALNNCQDPLAKDAEEEILYKMIDGERVPCTPEETAEIKAQWAQAAVESAKQQQISDLKAQDLSVADKIQCLMLAVNALIQGQSIPLELANKIESSSQIYDQIKTINQS